MVQNLVQEAIDLDKKIDEAILLNLPQVRDFLTDRLNTVVAEFSKLEQIEFDEYLRNVSPEVLYADYE